MLDPQARALLDAMPPMPEFDDAIDVVGLRAGMKAQSTLSPGEPEPVASVRDRGLPGPHGEIPVRIYTPEGSTPFPVLVFFHGGGFVLCDLDTHDGTCRSLAKGAGCVVVSVDYRLAPEHPFPAGPEDCYAALRWVAEHAGELGGDPSRIAVGGDSAGGNLTAAATLMARERGGPDLRFQLLVYPVTNCDFDTDSYRENAEGYFLTTSMMKWFWRQYLPDPSQAELPLASPLRAPDLSGLPPAHVVTAGYDPLRDEGEAYAARLREAGVAVTARRHDGMFHGFFAMTGLLDAAREAMDEACEALRKALA
jgi:acetyl esterase